MICLQNIFFLSFFSFFIYRNKIKRLCYETNRTDNSCIFLAVYKVLCLNWLSLIKDNLCVSCGESFGMSKDDVNFYLLIFGGFL